MRRLTDELNFGAIHFRHKSYPPDVINKSIDEVEKYLSLKYISNSPFVYLFAPNHIKTVYGVFGIIKSGRICVLVDPRIGPFELKDMLKDSPPGALIRIDKSTDAFDFRKEFEFKHYQLAPTRIQDLDDVAIMLYTAADDGFAKGAMLTHENLLADARAGIQCDPQHDDMVVCSLISMHHLFSLQTGVIIPSLISRSSLIIDDLQINSINEVALQMINLKLTYFYTVPFVYYLFLRLPNCKEVLGDIRCITSGGYALPQRIFLQCQEKTGRAIQEGYGLSEASPICTWNMPGDTTKQGSIGKPFPCCSIKIFDDANMELENGKTGEICIHGSNVMKGYYNNRTITEKSIVDGWLHTRDLGYKDEEGFLFLNGLKKRMLNVSGNKVYPAEVERYILRNNNVNNVEIFGETTGMMGDTLKARVRLRDNAKDAQTTFKDWCHKHLTYFKVPRIFEFSS